ncbi:hypothetical protein [Aurantivibrio plasticivorans]
MQDQGATYKKMAGTSAVFLCSDYQGASPVERDGETWNAQELHLNETSAMTQSKPAMANALALEGLEDYDPPSAGDVRHVSSLGVDFIYSDKIRGWIQFQS